MTNIKHTTNILHHVTPQHAHCIRATPILLLMWQIALQLYVNTEQIEYVAYAGTQCHTSHDIRNVCSVDMFSKYLFFFIWLKWQPLSAV